MIEHERTGPVDAVTWRFSRLAMVLPAVIVAIMLYEVITRYLMGASTYWANELSLWLGGMVFLFSGLYSMQQRSHIRIFILYDIVPKWMRQLFDVMSTLAIIIFCGATIWGGYGEAYSKLMRWERYGSAWDPPIPAIMLPLILLMLLLVTIQAVSNLIHDWGKDIEKHEVVEDLDIALEEVKRAQAAHDPEQDRT